MKEEEIMTGKKRLSQANNQGYITLQITKKRLIEKRLREREREGERVQERKRKFLSMYKEILQGLK